ncbi:hypothetical protein GGP41_001188 [Bipolaris sorokiniana]|uniref:Glucose-methanol-choline oxidoreductase N-terminal domain-containing protein n=2 Tax=Cochliobolus sativus TaxID=45130 RepID=A0A8H5ZB76_COCSA|nr:uncharacterized protein COCSADRAFT_166645 [Bipolaris sorokiniana ND90Pr]EMD69672.1 hypothetical protein COCSADRAFT_166645 [Bipolaris sorokiniana ND90Pr]KAF5845044.1 hypothetical protein GGP41_001188 [Bipolaris sorokiniana]
MASSYDFIIVGAGTAGPLLVDRLAHTHAAPRVLLLEAGTAPNGPYLRAPYHRYHAPALRPDLDHGYITEPEEALGGRQVAYTRGKGLGGCSMVNFAVYLYGSKRDYERWDQLVNDDGEDGEGTFKWDNVKRAFEKIENFDSSGSKTYRHLADPSTGQHGTKGKLNVGLPPILETAVQPQMEALMQAGEKLNLDPNSGDPVGISIFPATYAKQGRCTSATAHLTDPPKNLEIWTDAKVTKLLWEGKKVVGVVTEDGREATAKNEVIVCAGAIDSPRLLLLNGIGPKSELEALGIDVKVDLPGVGKNLHDHVLTFISVEVNGSVNDKYAFESNPEIVAEAEKAWEKDHSGALAIHNSALWGGFLKLPELETFEEYKALPKDFQEFLSKDEVPTYELIANSALWPPGTKLTEGNTYMSFIAFLMNPLSRGSVTLRSKDAADKPAIKLNYLTHPYDARVFREAVRNTWNKLTTSTALAPYIVRKILAPESMSDESIDAFAKENANTVWHAAGTCKMGKNDDKEAVVDKNFKVRGVEGLRVVDMSVAPVTTNNHTQATAYLVGQIASERLIKEYGLDK